MRVWTPGLVSRLGRQTTPRTPLVLPKPVQATSVLAYLPNKSPYPEEEYVSRGEQPPRLQYASRSEKGSPGPDPRKGSQSEEARQDLQKFPGRGSNAGTVPSGKGHGAGGEAGKDLQGNWFIHFGNRFLMSTV